jgi:hypothetical protein
MKPLQFILVLAVALSFLTIVCAMFGGPILLAYKLATVQGLLLTIFVAGFVGIACWFGVVKLDDLEK